MSGKRQHYFPQFLQRGFVSHTKGRAAYTWVYRKGSEPQNKTIRKSGFQNWFYTESDEKDADTQITVAEDGLADTVNHIRDENSANAVDARRLAELIAHCEIRTRTLRERFKGMGRYVIEQFCRRMQDPEVFSAFLRQELAKDPTCLDESIRNQLSKIGADENTIQAVLSNRELVLQAALPKICEGAANDIVRLRADVPKILDDSAKIGHIAAMQQEVAPEVRVRRYKKLAFSVVRSDSVSIPLGDSITVFLHDQGAWISPFCDKFEMLDCVILPISASQVLLGQATTYCPPKWALPRLIARTSHEQFVAAENSSSHRELSEEIGEEADLMPQEALVEIVRATLGDADPTNR